jgi:hypothetical protein
MKSGDHPNDRVEREAQMIVPLRNSNTITYGWEAAPRGSRFVVRMPRRAGISDQLAVMDWLKKFARQIQTEHPFWIVTFQTFQDGYALDVMPTDSVEEFVEQSLRTLA